MPNNDFYDNVIAISDMINGRDNIKVPDLHLLLQDIVTKN